MQDKSDKKKAKFDQSKDEEQDMSMKEYVETKINDMFVDSIPMDSIKELPSRYMYLMGILANLMLFACFMFFVVQGIYSGMNTKFISLDPTSGICSQIPRQVDGSFMATYDGYWMGAPGFKYNNAMYVLTLNQFQGTNQQYSDMMNYFGTQLSKLGNIAAQSPLTFNLLLWMSMTLEYKMGNSIQTLQLMGNPSMIFDGTYVYGSLGSSKGGCGASLSASFDVASSSLVVNFDYTNYYTFPACSNIPLYYLTNQWQYEATTVISVDARSLVTAMAMNMGLITIDSLSVLSSYYYEPSTVNLIDPRFPGMNYITCVNASSSKPTCFVSVGPSNGIPILNPAGYDLYYSSYCHCGLSSADNEYCSEFSLLAGIVFFDNSDDLYGALQQHSFEEFNKMAYNASLVGAIGMYDMYEDSFVKESFSFCNYTCFVLSWLTIEYPSAVSEYYYQVLDGSCADKVTTPNWNYFQTNPPAVLTENYYQCTATWINAAINSVGIANGNTATLLPVGVMVLLPLMYLYLKWIGYAPPKEEYSREERELALQELAIQLMRARDGKTRGLRQRGILQKISSDLVYAAQRPGGYPDSDDEASDDSDDEQDSGDEKSPKKASDQKETALPRRRVESMNIDHQDDEITKVELVHKATRRRSSMFALKKVVPRKLESKNDDGVDANSSEVVDNAMHV